MIIVIATDEELQLVERLGYKNNPVLITGVGAINVINALKHLPKDTPILNIGYCGSNKYEVGKKVMIGQVKTYHENVSFDEKFIACTIDGGWEIAKCYTSTDFVLETKIKEPCVFDMELAYIRAMFDSVKSIKVVSDNLNVEDYEKNIKK